MERWTPTAERGAREGGSGTRPGRRQHGPTVGRGRCDRRNQRISKLEAAFEAVLTWLDVLQVEEQLADAAFIVPAYAQVQALGAEYFKRVPRSVA